MSDQQQQPIVIQGRGGYESPDQEGTQHVISYQRNGVQGNLIQRALDHESLTYGLFSAPKNFAFRIATDMGWFYFGAGSKLLVNALWGLGTTGTVLSWTIVFLLIAAVVGAISHAQRRPYRGLEVLAALFIGVIFMGM